MYNLFTFIHVLTVVVWIGGTITMKVLTGRIARTNDRALITAVATQNEFLASRLLAPASGLLLLSGIATVFASSPSLFKEVWVGLGIVGWILLGAIGHGLIVPQSRRLKQAMAETGPGHPDVARISRRLDRLGRVELTLFVLLIADMVFKPGMH